MKKMFEVAGKTFRSYRRKFKIYYAMTFLVPVIVILIVNVFTTHMLKAQAIESGQKTIAQFFNVMEERMSMFTDDAYGIVRNRGCLEYASLIKQNPKKYSHRKYFLLKEEFANLGLRGYSQCYNDVFIWFSSDDYVVSSLRGDQPVVDFCKMNYSKQDEFVSQFEANTTSAPTVPKFWALEDEQGKSYLFISLKQAQTNDPMLDYVVTIELDAQELLKAVGDGVLSEKTENLIFFNRSGELLLSYGAGGMTYLPEEYRVGGIYEVEDGGEEYTIFVKESKSMKGFYVMQIAHDAFYENQIRISVISALGILVSIIAGVFAMRRFSRATYKPLETVLNEVQEKVSRRFDAHACDEYEFIMESLRTVNRGGEGLGRMMEKEKQIRIRELLRIALDGRELLEEEISFLEKEEVFQNGSGYCVGVMQLQNCGEVGWDILAFVISNVFEELSEEVGKGYVVSYSAAYHAIILQTVPQISEDSILQLLKKGQEFLNEHFRINMQMGIGSICSGVSELHSVYREAQIAYGYLFLSNDSDMIRYGEISMRQYVAPISIDGSVYNRLQDFLQNKSEEKSKIDFIERLFDIYNIGVNSSMDAVEMFRIEILNALGRVFIKNGVTYVQMRFYMELLLDARNLEQYKNHLVYILKELDRVVPKDDRKKMLSLQIKEYVDAHFSEQEMSVTAIGEVFNMQAAYLSRIFKEEYHVLLLDYIIDRRIHYSKKLLMDDRLTVNEIAEQSGFLSGSVFIKTFKRVVGITPGKYRMNAGMVNRD